MATVKENDNPVFDVRTLRMIVGAFAFGLPGLVYILDGKITTSISASYHEAPTRNIFVGSLFVIGALLISYQGQPYAAHAVISAKKRQSAILSHESFPVGQVACGRINL